MKTLIPLLLLFTASECLSDDVIIHRRCQDSEIIIRAAERFAGAIDSLIYRGKEHIDRADHGRQLQSASNFDLGTPFTPETFNPTEAGSRWDGDKQTTTSRWLHRLATKESLQTTSQMAFWLKPGETSAGNPAKNPGPLSNHLLTKRVRIGYRNFDNVLDYRVTFSTPLGEMHRYAQFEILTGYMPTEFSQFWIYNPDDRQVKSIDDGPGEQADPVILSTKDQKFAMGIYMPPRMDSLRGPGYGRFRFVPQRVVKWNCVYRLRSKDQAALEAGDYSFQCFVILGTLAEVAETMKQITSVFMR